MDGMCDGRKKAHEALELLSLMLITSTAVILQSSAIPS